MKKCKWRRAVITAEAAFIVPVAAVMIAIVIGYIYFIHQRVWCSAAAYESVFYGIQAEADKDSDLAERVDHHMSERIKDSPIVFSGIRAESDKKEGRIISSWEMTVLPETFREYFSAKGNESIKIIRASELKRAAWVISNI